jgi:hypothetical protein
MQALELVVLVVEEERPSPFFQCSMFKLGRIQRQPPDSCHTLDMLVLIVYTTTMAFNICK